MSRSSEDRAALRAALAQFTDYTDTLHPVSLSPLDERPGADSLPIIRERPAPGLALDFTPLYMARRLRHWSQGTLAARAEIGVATLRRIENGAGLYNPSAWTLGKLAAALDLPLSALWRPIDLDARVAGVRHPR